MANRTAVMESKQAVEAPDRPPKVRPLANRNFRLLWIGESVSLFGDQFYLIALPWLVFQLTGSALVFGTLLMVAGIPRAVFMLYGGVVTDRFSARTVMIVSNWLRLALTVLLLLLVAGQVVHVGLLFVIEFGFGLVDAFFYPAYRAVIPLIVEPDGLQASNALHQGTSQLVQTAGPAIAGEMVRRVGVVVSFAFDAFTFLFTSIMLLMMSPAALPRQEAHPEGMQKRRRALDEIGALLTYVRHDAFLSRLILVVATINLVFAGPLIVGAATLGKVRFSVEGSAAFGAMLSTFSVGSMIGALASASVRSRWIGVISLLLLAVQGLLMVGLAFAPTLLIACIIMALMGLGAGFGSVSLITLTQKRVAKEMMGRFMSLIALAEVGLVPISNALAGILADANVALMYVLGGTLLTLTTLLALMSPTMRRGEA
ncbi:MAG TPA: MFS transporter [Aggregatilineaceae bacterium]|nr:MFS transporter [Aggregatilineaceae bacterium]